MKIIQIATGIVEFPPKGWGAIEYIIWNYKLELEKLGHSVDVLGYWEFFDKYNSGFRDFDFIHIHISDQSYFLIENQIPYFFTIHDIHTYLYDNNSHEYIHTYVAIQNSITTFVPSMILIERYNQFKTKMVYIRHGVDNKKYVPVDKNMENIKLLCVSNNVNIAGHIDNKGYVLASSVAKKR